MDAAEEKALADIHEHGCHILSVLEEDGLPPFAYSVGIQHSSHAPEVIVVGLKHEVACFVINEYNRRVRAGENFKNGDFGSDFLEGFEIQFLFVDKSHYPEYFGWNRWFYKGDEFQVLQIVYPDTAGNWPWSDKASDWFKAWQILLNEPANNA